MSAHGCVLNLERLSGLDEIWRRLFDVAQDVSPFVSYEWFSIYARNLLLSDPQVVVFRVDGAVVGLMPATVSSDTLNFIGDERVTDLNGMVCIPGYDKSIVDALADFVRRRGVKLDLYPLEAGSALASHLNELLSGVLVEKKDKCPLLDLPRTYDDYLGSLDGKSRHELRRKMRKINGTAIHVVETADIESLLRLMAASDNSKGKFLTPDMVAFFSQLADTFNRIGWLRMRALLLDERPIGMILAFAMKERVYLYNMGFDPEFRSMSPGIMTVALDIQSAIREGYKYYDFLRGDEDYKYRLGAKERYTVRITR